MSETLAEYEAASQNIVNLAAASLSAAPDLTEAERTARFQTVVRGTTAFEPADPTETMLATLILGHHLAIMDGFRDIARLPLTPPEAAKARMVTVAQTKLVLQLVRELRIARKEAQARTGTQPARQWAAGCGEPAQGYAGDAGCEASLARLFSTYAETLATLENTDPLTPAAAAKANEALSQAMGPPPGPAPREERAVEEGSVPAPVTGSRAQRRAMMKRQGLFKRTA